MNVDPYADKRESAAKAKEHAEAYEKVLVGNLLNTEAGRWILGKVFAEFRRGVTRKSTGHNSDDSYHRGRQDFAREQVDLIVKHFGYAGIDTLLKGKS